MNPRNRIELSDVLADLRHKRGAVSTQLFHYKDAETRELHAFHTDEPHDRAEESTARQEDDNAAAIIHHLTGELRALDIAIRRLENNDTACITCANPIPLERLHAQPEALRCLSCQTKAEA
ncbi:MAG: TraR/DksA C4-type zinc finger protein [Gammaproteobacteria bacterium]|nr:TraR/DksA C4-type zinc finger protein [Gammaproteobacteria bacterium]